MNTRLGWSTFHILISEDIDYFTDIMFSFCICSKCARARKRVLTAQKSCAVGMRNAILITSSLAKRSQHINATYRNIVGPNMLLAFGHRVATCWVLFAQV